MRLKENKFTGEPIPRSYTAEDSARLIERYYEDQPVKFLIYDDVDPTDSVHRGARDIRKYYCPTDCSFVLFDLTSHKSFRKVRLYMEKIHQFCPLSCPLVLIGTKSDLKDHRTVTPEEIKELIDKKKLPLYFEISSKDGTGLEEMFGPVITELRLRRRRDSDDSPRPNYGPY